MKLLIPTFSITVLRFVPFATAYEIWVFASNVFDTFTESISPLLKVPTVLYLDKNFYFGQDIEKYQGELGGLFGVNIPKKYVHILQNIRFLNDMSKVSTSFGREILDVKSDVSPQIPTGGGMQEFGRDMMGIFGGTKTAVNDRPEMSKYFNYDKPIKEAKSLFRKK